jgi:hypothetical protein
MAPNYSNRRVRRLMRRALIGGSGRRSAVESWVPLHIDHPVQHGTG